MALKAKVKEKWLKALRSGKYPQITGRLGSKDSGGCCCLGVLNEVCELGYTSYNDSIGTVGQAKTGLTDKNIERLIMMNDKENKSFKEIAAYISRNL